MFRFNFILSAAIGFVTALMLTTCASRVPNNTCSPEGNMFMEHIDTLVLSVKKKELTEAEAMRRYTEYKNGGTPSHP